MIDLSCINLKNLSADDNGVWVTSSPRRTYEIKKKDGKIISVNHIGKITPETSKRDIVTLCQQYGTHQATPEFRCIIAYVLDHNGVIMTRAVVQYFFLNDKKVPVCVALHGNSKGNRPYYCTQPTTLQSIKV